MIIGVTNGTADKDEDGPKQTKETNGGEDEINQQKDVQGQNTLNSTSSDESEMRSEQV